MTVSPKPPPPLLPPLSSVCQWTVIGINCVASRGWKEMPVMQWQGPGVLPRWWHHRCVSLRWLSLCSLAAVAAQHSSRSFWWHHRFAPNWRQGAPVHCSALRAVVSPNVSVLSLSLCLVAHSWPVNSHPNGPADRRCFILVASAAAAAAVHSLLHWNRYNLPNEFSLQISLSGILSFF